MLLCFSFRKRFKIKGNILFNVNEISKNPSQSLINSTFKQFCALYSVPRGAETLRNVHNDWGEYGSEEACDWLLSPVALVILLCDWQMGLATQVCKRKRAGGTTGRLHVSGSISPFPLNSGVRAMTGPRLQEVEHGPWPFLSQQKRIFCADVWMFPFFFFFGDDKTKKQQLDFSSAGWENQLKHLERLAPKTLPALRGRRVKTASKWRTIGGLISGS